MIIVNAILYLSSAWYSILSFNQLFIIEIVPYSFVAKNIGNYRKYDIFFNFRFTGNMIFPSIAENQENMIFTLSVFTKMLFFMQWLYYSNIFLKLQTFPSATFSPRFYCLVFWTSCSSFYFLLLILSTGFFVFFTSFASIYICRVPQVI